jgi:hypothetical protein
VLWRQPVLLLGTTSAVVAGLTMLALMTAGPILGLAAGRTGSAMIASSYRPGERGRVQPVAEVLGIAAQVGGSSAAAATTRSHQ